MARVRVLIVMGLMVTCLVGYENTVVGASTTVPALNMTQESAAQEQNKMGVQAYDQEQWTKASSHFQEAIRMDPQAGVPQYNLALVLHKLDEHMKAASHFKQAANLSPNNSKIQNSGILQEHLKMLKE